MSWYVYEMSPIDYGWSNLKTVKDTAAELGAAEAAARAAGVDFLMYEELLLETFLADWQSAQIAAQEHGWAGEFRHAPVVFWVPNDSTFIYGFTFKQDTNGTTYVVSPVPMPWLEI